MNQREEEQKNERWSFDHANYLHNTGGNFRIWRRKEEMTRLEENTEVIKFSTNILEAFPNEMQMQGVKIGILSDISKSLAVIADAMTEAGGKEKKDGTQ